MKIFPEFGEFNKEDVYEVAGLFGKVCGHDKQFNALPLKRAYNWEKCKL